MPPRPPSLLISPILRRLLLRPFSSTSVSSDHHRFLLPSQPQRRCPFPTNPFFSFTKHFSSQTLTSEDLSQLSESLSSELIKPSESDSLPLSQRLDLSFSHVTFSPPLILQTLNSSPAAGRAALDFLSWVSAKLPLSDEVCSFFIHYFGRRRDFKAVDEILGRGKGVLGPLTFDALVDRLIRAGRPAQAVSAFDRMEFDLGIPRNREALNLVVSKLCEHGYASCAEKMVKSLANEFFPDEHMCDLLIKGWCIDGKLDEARRLAREMYRGGFEIGVNAYNAILDCVCTLCRKKDPFKMQLEANQVLVDMDAAGIPRNLDTFNVMIKNLCKIRKTEDAMQLFSRMGEWGIYPDDTTFLLLTNSLYQAARIGEGDEMIDRMKSAGYGGTLDTKTYYGFLKILCGIERIDHALSVFGKMKEGGCKPGVKTYDLLIERLGVHGRVDKANALFNEAVREGLPVEPKAYKVDPRFLKKKPVAVRKEKKRLTLPEKTALKRKKLKKIRLSYVKKPRSMQHTEFETMTVHIRHVLHIRRVHLFLDLKNASLTTDYDKVGLMILHTKIPKSEHASSAINGKLIPKVS
ncbi:hypothetical protein V2J09_019441 [Rumex salicifolius]